MQDSLIIAEPGGKQETVEWLLEHGFSIEERDEHGKHSRQCTLGCGLISQFLNRQNADLLRCFAQRRPSHKAHFVR